MAYEQLIFDVVENIAVLRMNRPNKKNAFSPTMSNEILDAMTQIENDDGIRGVLLTGVEDSFSAGLDLDLSFCQTMEEGNPTNFAKS